MHVSHDPNAVEPSIDDAAEPMTLVEFRLEDAAGGTRLTIVESGFDACRPTAGKRRSA